MVSINIYDLVMQLVNFGILYLLISYILAKPLGKFLNERRNNIKADLDHSRLKLQEAEALLADQTKLMQTAKDEARELKKKSEEATALQKEEIISTARSEAQRIVDQARTEINQNIDKAKEELQKETAKLALNLTSRLIKKNIDQAANEDIIGETLKKK